MWEGTKNREGRQMAGWLPDRGWELLLLLLILFSSHSSFETGYHYVAKSGFELTILPPQPS
jgi:hypothetical protein